MSAEKVKSRDFADIVSETYNVLKANFVQLIAIAAIVEGIMFVIRIIVMSLVPEMNDPGVSGFLQLGGEVGGLLAIILCTVVLSVAMQGALIHATAEQYSRKPVGVARAFVFSLNRIGTLLVAAFVALVAITAMFVTVIGIPFAVYFGIRWVFIPQAVILEAKSWREAFSRSSTLVKDSWWRVFGIYAAIVLISAGVGGVLGFTLGLVPWIGTSLVIILTAPIVAVGSTILYYDLVSREEGYLLETATSLERS